MGGVPEMMLTDVRRRRSRRHCVRRPTRSTQFSRTSLHVAERGLHALGQFPQATGDHVRSLLEVAVGQEPQAA